MNLKSILIWLVMIYPVSSSIHAQVLLDLADWRSDYRYHGPQDRGTLPNGFDRDAASMEIGYIKYHTGSGPYSWYVMSGNAGVEFDLNATIDGGVFPTAGMTESNWRAFLDIETRPAGFANGMEIGIHNLEDAFEEGEMTEMDFDHVAEGVSSCYAPNEPVMTTHDITDALRHDLFGESPPVGSSGFIFIHYGTGMTNPFILTVHPLRIIVTPNPIPTSTPEPSATQTPIPTTEPSATPTSTPWMGVRFEFPLDHFTGGDRFKLEAQCRSGDTDIAADLIVALDIMGQYWFFPDWTRTVDSTQIELHENTMIPVSILDFTWPMGDFGQVEGLRFIGAMVDMTRMEAIGESDEVWFSYD